MTFSHSIFEIAFFSDTFLVNCSPCWHLRFRLSVWSGGKRHKTKKRQRQKNENKLKWSQMKKPEFARSSEAGWWWGGGWTAGAGTPWAKCKIQIWKWNTQKKQIWNQNTIMEHLVQGACLHGGEVPRLVRRMGDHVDGEEEGEQEWRRKCSQDWWKFAC